MLADIIRQWGGYEVTPMQAYRDVFKLGEGYIQTSEEPAGQFKANPIAYWKNDNSETGHFRIMFEDTFEETLKELQDADFAILNGTSYFGRRNVQEHASKMYAMPFDLDDVTDTTLTNFFSGAFNAGVYPIPQFIALSGSGVHLYYVFEEPVPLFPNIKLQLKELKYALTDKIWNRYTSENRKVQHQGINQGFRVLGGKTKAGEVVRVFRVNEHPTSLTELCEYVPAEHRIDENKLFRESKYTLAEAKDRFPEWYERVVVGKDKTRAQWDISGKVHGADPWALYHWWLDRVREGATFGHRYFAVMCLAIYGVKCSVPFEKVKEDVYSLIPFLDELNPREPFTQSDVDTALECYDSRYCTFPIKDIAKLSGIDIPRNKRNGRKQSTHIKYMNHQRAFKVDMGECTNGGRPTSQNIVQEWQVEHPSGRKVDCARETGLDPKTVRKWWTE